MVGKMKKISFLFVFLYFITLLFVVACSETGELPVAPVPEIPSITIPSTENTRLVFTSDGGEDTLAFIATTGWSVAIKTADLAGDWLAVSPLTGNKGDNELIITLASNPSAEDREGETLVAASSLQFEWPAFSRTLHGIARRPLCVPADKHGIMIGQGLIEVAALQACVDHFPGNAAPCQIAHDAR